MRKIKLLTIGLLLISLIAIVATRAKAEVIFSQISFDPSLAEESQYVFSYPSKIYFSQITTSVENMTFDSKSWIKMLYYYFATREKLPDIPYNYIIDRSGNIFRGHSGYDGVQPGLQDDQVVLIGFLSNSADIPVPAQEAFVNLVTEISESYGIDSGNLSVVELDVISNSSGDALPELKYNRVDSTFSENLSEVIKGVKFSTSSNLKYQGSVSDVEYSETGGAGEEIDVTLTLKNKNNFPWNTADQYIYVSTVDGSESDYAINGVWDSFSKPMHIEGVSILPNEEIEVKFKLGMPLRPVADAVEKFQFVLSDGRVVEDTEFEVSFTVTAGDFDLIQVLDNDAGFLNVRSCPGYSCARVGEVEVNGIYILVDEQNGWYKIKYEGDEEGWVLGSFVKKL